MSHHGCCAALRFHKHTFCLCDRHRMLGYGPSKRRKHSSAVELRCHCRPQPQQSQRQRGNVADNHLQAPAEVGLAQRCSCWRHIPTFHGCGCSHSRSCSYGRSCTCSKCQCCSHSHRHSCCSNRCSYRRSLRHVCSLYRRPKGHPEPGLVREEQKHCHRQQQLHVMQTEASPGAAQKQCSCSQSHSHSHCHVGGTGRAGEDTSARDARGANQHEDWHQLQRWNNQQQHPQPKCKHQTQMCAATTVEARHVDQHHTQAAAGQLDTRLAS